MSMTLKTQQIDKSAEPLFPVGKISKHRKLVTQREVISQRYIVASGPPVRGDEKAINRTINSFNRLAHKKDPELFNIRFSMLEVHDPPVCSFCESSKQYPNTAIAPSCCVEAAAAFSNHMWTDHYPRMNVIVDETGDVFMSSGSPDTVKEDFEFWKSHGVEPTPIRECTVEKLFHLYYVIIPRIVVNTEEDAERKLGWLTAIENEASRREIDIATFGEISGDAAQAVHSDTGRPDTDLDFT